MKFLWFGILILALIYLNRSYAYFYDYLGEHPLSAPGQQVSPLQKTEVGKAKFVTLGDSLMAGVGTNEYQDSLAYLLYERSSIRGSASLYKGVNGNNDLDLVNLGIPGAEVKDVVNVELPAAIKENPKQVIVLIGVNDVHNLVPITTFQKNYQTMAQVLAAQTTSQVTLINIPYLGSNLVLLPPWNMVMDLRTQQFNRVIAQTARQYNLKVVDLYSLSKQSFVKSSALYSIDQFHPSAAGYVKWAEYIDHAN